MAKRTSVPLTNYFFLSDKSVKIIATAFIDDLTFDSLTIIQNMFDGSLEGFNTKYPVDLTAYPIFNYRSLIWNLNLNFYKINSTS